MNDKLILKLSEAMIHEMELKRQIRIMREALEYYAAGNGYRAKEALWLVSSENSIDEKPYDDEINAV